MKVWTPDVLDEFPRLGWADAPTPIDALPSLAAELSLDWLGVKRDDLADGLYGSTKTRKLDFLLATPPWSEEAVWTSAGAIGSGHLASLALAAAKLDRRVEAHCFWEPPSTDVETNLGALASGPTTIHYHRSRIALATSRPTLIWGIGGSRGVVPPGASAAAGVVGVVRGGLELAMQIQSGDLPAPDRVYVPCGTGGTAVGIALGLALGGSPTPVFAISTVERHLAGKRRLERLRHATGKLLEDGIGPLPAGLSDSPLKIVHGYVGAGYGYPTDAAVAACRRLAAADVRAEPVYGGKAFAALLEREVASGGGRVLYWLTSHRGDLPRAPDWRDRLPRRLTADLARGRPPHGPSRRQVLAGAAAAAVVAVVRTRGYDALLPRWNGVVLARWEAAVVAAAAEAVIPDVPGPLLADGPSGEDVARAVDVYLRGMSAPMLQEVHAMMILLEQGTPLGFQAGRLTRLDPAARRRFLVRLSGYGGLLALASRGIRDLCFLGWYQDPRTWPLLGYRAAPLVRGRRSPRYEGMAAPAGRLPGTAVG